jgi:hypothetical protein
MTRLCAQWQMVSRLAGGRTLCENASDVLDRRESPRRACARPRGESEAGLPVLPRVRDRRSAHDDRREAHRQLQLERLSRSDQSPQGEGGREEGDRQVRLRALELARAGDDDRARRSREPTREVVRLREVPDVHDRISSDARHDRLARRQGHDARPRQLQPRLHPRRHLPRRRASRRTRPRSASSITTRRRASSAS